MADTQGWSQPKLLREVARNSNAPSDWQAATVAALWERRDAIIRALGSAQLTIRIGDHSEQFRSIAELQSALVTIEAQIRKGASIAPRVSSVTVLSSFEK